MEELEVSTGAEKSILDGVSEVSKEFHPVSAERHFLSKG